MRAHLPALAGWMWRALAFLALAAVGALVAIAVSDGASNGSSAATTARTLTQTSEPTTTIAPPPTRTRRTTTTTTTVPQPGPGLTVWPNRDGWTVVLQSLPAGGPRTSAERTARAALAAGLAQVGVLDSSAFASLHPGYLVVFAGVYPSAGAAGAAVGQARAAGFPSAYTRPIAR